MDKLISCYNELLVSKPLFKQRNFMLLVCRDVYKSKTPSRHSSS
jgi:hypothetical protein